MNLSAPFIRRPVMTTLVMASCVAFGLAAYRQLPVSDLPAVDFPTIQVTASLPGASPETMAAAVATPLERQFSTIAGLAAMNSSSGQGTTQITLEFDLDRDIDAAAQDVQSMIAAAAGQLPPNLPTPPTFRKVNPADFPILFLALTSPTLPLSELNRYGQDLIGQRISTIAGVAQVDVRGAQKYAARIELDPRALAARGIGLDEAAAAIRAANSNLPTGAVQGSARAFTVDSTGGLVRAKEFRDVVIAYRHGAPVRVSDVGRARDGVENERAAAWYWDEGREQRAIVLAVLRQPGTNTVEVAQRIRELLPVVQQQLPAAATLDVLFDRSESIRESVADVKSTLVLTLALVVLVIFLFLRNLPATFIPSLALPVSLVGTFALMKVLGYSLDNLSLMALTLAVGFVVDDAIVMLENVVRHMEQGKPPLQAAFDGSREVAFTIVSMTISLAAVFLPVLFMGGIVGRLFHEFAVTIGAAILVSGLVSLTLTPMLCSRFLAPGKEAHHGRLYAGIEAAFDRSLRAYDRGLTWSLHHPRAVLACSAAVLVATAVLGRVVPKGFLPGEDTGRISVTTEGAEDASWDAMVRAQREASAIVARHPAVEQFMTSVGGRSTAGQTQGNMFLKLKDRRARPERSLGGLGLLLVMALVVIYVVLGILYESFVHPVTILTALPFAGFGALVTLLAFRTELSIYAYVGVVMLVGLVKKNGIMMVDFALEAQRAGRAPREAIHEACLVRFRPIMMTTMAALIGTLPIALGMGAGAESRRPLGLAVVGGLLFSQLLTLFVTPVFYVGFERLRSLGRGGGARPAVGPGDAGAPGRSAAAPTPTA